MQSWESADAPQRTGRDEEADRWDIANPTGGPNVPDVRFQSLPTATVEQLQGALPDGNQFVAVSKRPTGETRTYHRTRAEAEEPRSSPQQASEPDKPKGVFNIAPSPFNQRVADFPPGSLHWD